ncbi:unnamed protein product [Angiostrongylus costaricensis]|uniref:Uncharacterized protein n=1 Tax=Angiostrongylus costaricensis TaxID=334426 RepID=A0A0R3PN18_ANGCS|nr:unnamed protein product [Angiostrongylus costaricensis]
MIPDRHFSLSVPLTTDEEAEAAPERGVPRPRIPAERRAVRRDTARQRSARRPPPGHLRTVHGLAESSLEPVGLDEPPCRPVRVELHFCELLNTHSP